jgi:hypothetical protein
MAGILGNISSRSLPLDGLAVACDQYIEELAGAVECMYEGPLFVREAAGRSAESTFYESILRLCANSKED